MRHVLDSHRYDYAWTWYATNIVSGPSIIFTSTTEKKSMNLWEAIKWAMEKPEERRFSVLANTKWPIGYGFNPDGQLKFLDTEASWGCLPCIESYQEYHPVEKPAEKSVTLDELTINGKKYRAVE